MLEIAPMAVAGIDLKRGSQPITGAVYGLPVTLAPAAPLVRWSLRAKDAAKILRLTLQLGDVGLFAAFLAAIGVAEPLAARIRRTFASPRRLHEALDRATNGETAAPAPPGASRRIASAWAAAPGASIAMKRPSLAT